MTDGTAQVVALSSVLKIFDERLAQYENIKAHGGLTDMGRHAEQVVKELRYQVEFFTRAAADKPPSIMQSCRDAKCCLYINCSVIEAEARRIASMYPVASDGHNTFRIFADWVASLAAQPPAAPVETLSSAEMRDTAAELRAVGGCSAIQQAIMWEKKAAEVDARSSAATGDAKSAGDLVLIWRGWANALRLMDAKRSEPQPEAQAQADAYEQCATELREALSAAQPQEVKESFGTIAEFVERVTGEVREALSLSLNRLEAIEEYRKGERLAIPNVHGTMAAIRSALATLALTRPQSK